MRPAVQLMSETVSAAIDYMLPQFKNEASAIRLIDSFFDVLNSRKPRDALKPLRCGFGLQLEQQRTILERMITFAADSRVKGRQSLLPFQKGIMASSRATLQLFHYLRERLNIQYILTHRLTQDCLESYFARVRGQGGFSDHPSPVETQNRIRALLIGSTDGTIVSNSCNVEYDLDTDANTLTATLLPHLLNKNKSSNHPLKSSGSSDLGFNGPEEDAMAYISGYVAYKLRASHSTLGTPTSKLEEEQRNVANPWIMKISWGGLRQPSEEWLRTCKELEELFRKITGTGIKGSATIQTLLDSAKHQFGADYAEEPMRLYLRTRTFMRLRELNATHRAASRQRSARKKVAKLAS